MNSSSHDSNAERDADVREFSGHGVRFAYPAEWQLVEEPSFEGVMISVQSPGTAFWSVSLQFEGPDAESVLQAAVEIFRDEYPELDAYAVEETLCHRSCAGCDIEFVCMELLNTARLRSFRTGRFTALVLYQANDAELGEAEDLLEAISASLQCDGDELLFDETAQS